VIFHLASVESYRIVAERARVSMSAFTLDCVAKSRFALVLKNFARYRRGFRAKM